VLGALTAQFSYLNLLGPTASALLIALRVDGGRGRIRTSVARKERQIYSLLVLATHPPVLENPFVIKLLLRQPLADKRFKNVRGIQAKTQKGLVSKDTSPFVFALQICSA
jgi:hypothetical protein